MRVLSVHNVHGGGDGVALNALTEMRHFHYRGLGATAGEGNLCTATEPGGGLQMNEVALLAAKARKCPLRSPKVMILLHFFKRLHVKGSRIPLGFENIDMYW